MSLSNLYPTEKYRELDAAHHMHPFTHQSELNAKGARIITQAQGVHLTDSEGEILLDGMSGLWCVMVGYGRTSLSEVAQAQMNTLPFYNTFFQTSHPPVIKLSEKLAQIAPNMSRVFYGSSGSEANDTNIRAVRQYWANLGKPECTHIISRWNAYHGSTMGGGSLGGMKGIHAQGGLPIPEIHHIEQPDWWGEGGEMSPEDFGKARAQLLEQKILEIGPEKVAAFIGEPIQGAGGVIIPPKTYWPEIQRICKEYDILLIADEVITGFGRTGNWFGCETFEITPDIITTAKGLTSGYIPMSASLFSEKVASNLAETPGEFTHGYTYSGHPVAAAVAFENIKIIEEDNLVENARYGAGAYLREKWRALSDHPLVGEAVISGMMGAIQLTPDKIARAKFAADSGTVGYICREFCFENGLVMRHVGDRMIIAPSLSMTNDNVDELIEKAWKCLDLTHAKIKSEGIT